MDINLIVPFKIIDHVQINVELLLHNSRQIKFKVALDPVLANPAVFDLVFMLTDIYLVIWLV